MRKALNVYIRLQQDQAITGLYFWHQISQLMNVLLFGSGGRESALAWKLAQSPLLDHLFIAPGNPGMKKYGTCIGLDWKDRDAVSHLCEAENIGMVVIGPEDPLVDGLSDFFAQTPGLKHIHVIGPKKAAAQLEGSKDFSKQFMERHGIPTAGHRTFEEHQLEEAKQYLAAIDGPYVLKADGLAAGKGVVILDSLSDAVHEMDAMLGQAKFGAASSRVVVEEFLVGIEFSMFALTDGKDYMMMPEAKDYKRIGEGDQGLNTGGMGAVSPVPFVTETIRKEVLTKIVEPTIRGLALEKMDYVGFIFFGLILTNKGVKVIEYNCRMGDPETEVVIPRVDEDLLPLFADAAKKQLLTRPMAKKEEAACAVMMVSGGYPEAYSKGRTISGLEKVQGVHVFHAGTAEKDGQIVTQGGRVLCVTGMAPTASAALTLAYAQLDQIEFEGAYRRNDIGVDLGLRNL